MTMTADPPQTRRRLADTPISGPSATVSSPEDVAPVAESAPGEVAPAAGEQSVLDTLAALTGGQPAREPDPLQTFLGAEWAAPDAVAVPTATPPPAVPVVPELEAPEADIEDKPSVPPPVGLYPDDIPVIESIVAPEEIEEDVPPAIVEPSREALTALAMEAAASIANGWQDPNAPEDPSGITLVELREILVTPIGTTASESAQKRRRSMIPWIVAAVVFAASVAVVGTWFAIKLHGA